MNPTETGDLMQRLLDGENPPPEEFAAIERELLENPEARRTWRDLARLHSAIEVHYASRAVANEGPGIVPVERVLARQRIRMKRVSLLAAAAVVLISILGFWLVLSPPHAAIAGLRVAPGSEFFLTHDTPDPKAGRDLLTEGSRLTLRHGVAELELPHDVRAVIRAPAEVVLVDARTLRLDHGQAFFEVASPAGRGFTVVTPHQRVVDLGTAFGVDARPGSSEVELRVFEGKVRTESPGGVSGEILTAPRTVMLEGAAIIRELNASGGGFLRSLPETIETILWEDFETGLKPLTGYSVSIDPTLILDENGNRFAGFSDQAPWRFRTGLPNMIRIPNASFEEDGERVGKGRPIRHWKSVSPNEWGWGVDFERDGLSPAHGDFFGRLFGGNAIAQTLETPIIEGTTYVLTLDVVLVPDAASSESTAIVTLFGSDLGQQHPLAEFSLTATEGGWQSDRHLHFTATDAHATGQTLGIKLRCGKGTALFDDLRLQSFGATPPETSRPPARNPVPEAGKSPALLSLNPEAAATDADPGAALTLTFDRPIRLGTGRAIIRNILEGTEQVLVSGSDRLSVSGPVLTIRPPADLADGKTHFGILPGWHSSGVPAGLFSPTSAGGVVGAMRGRHIARLAAGGPHAAIRRELGVILPARHYAASLAIATSDPADFPGYTIRLVSGDTVLAEHTSRTPPNHMETVSLAWNSSELPAGITPGDPLAIEIAPVNSAGYLDIDNVRVTTVPAGR